LRLVSLPADKKAIRIYDKLYQLIIEEVLDMQKNTAKEMIEIPKDEYKMLKEIYKTVKRQRLLFRIEEAEKNLRLGKVKKVSVDQFIDSI
jgi:predicted alternative tryptophan synthase beta-subunit